jgi:hypothetical protein
LSKQYHIRWRKCQKYFYVTHWQKKLHSNSYPICTVLSLIALSFLESTSRIQIFMTTLQFSIDAKITSNLYINCKNWAQSFTSFWSGRFPHYRRGKSNSTRCFDVRITGYNNGNVIFFIKNFTLTKDIFKFLRFCRIICDTWSFYILQKKKWKKEQAINCYILYIRHGFDVRITGYNNGCFLNTSPHFKFVFRLKYKITL